MRGRDTPWVKAIEEVPLGRHRYGLVSGVGTTPFAPGSQADYALLAGDLSANSVVAICLGWIRDTMPQATLRVGYEIDGQTEPEEAGVLPYKLKTRPNPHYTWRQTWGATCDGFKIDGNAYWLKARDDQTGLMEDMYWVPNASIRIRTDSLGFIEAYEYWPSGVFDRDYLPDDVVHFRDGIDPINPVLGISRLKRVLRSIAGINAGETYTAAILRNMGVANALLIPPDGLGWDDRERTGIVREIGNQIRGESAGRLAAVSIPMRVEDVGGSPEEVMLDRILDRPEAMICAALGVNSLVTGLPGSDNVRTFSNIESANRMAWTNSIIPMQDVFAETLRDSLAYEYDLPEDAIIYWDRSKVEALQEQADSRVARAVSLFEGKMLPQNRCLDIADEEPVEGGDDRYYDDPSPRAEAQMAADQAAFEAQQAAQLAVAEDVPTESLDEESAVEPEPEPEPVATSNGKPVKAEDGALALPSDDLLKPIFATDDFASVETTQDATVELSASVLSVTT
ncbi:MAG: phage portal protein [Phycisphaerales bacterium]